MAASAMGWSATITLQQGSNSYSGCSDSYMESGITHDSYNGSVTVHGSEDRIGVGELSYT